MPTPHFANFVECVKSGAKPNCDIEEGYKSTLLAHTGNLTYRLGRPLTFDAKTHSFKNDADANALLKRSGRGAFVIPESV